MKNLIRFTQLLKDLKLKSTDFFFSDKKEKDDFDLFFDALLEGKFKTEEQAASQLFGVPKRYPRYQNFKENFKEKLVNSLFFYNLIKKGASDYELAYLYCSKYLIAAKLCFRLAARKIGTELSINVLKKATKFELAEFASDAAKLLRKEYALYRGNIEKFHYYNKIYHFQNETFLLENLAEEYYLLITLPYANAKTVQASTYQEGKRYYEELAPYLQKYSSPFLHFMTHLINIITHLSINDFQTASSICTNVLPFFEQKPYAYNTPIRVILLNHLICCIHLKDYAKGKEIVLKTERYIKKGSFAWFRQQELHLALAFHSKSYDLAPNIINMVLKHSEYRDLRDSIRERWLINEAYFHLLIQLRKIVPTHQKMKRFNLGKFLNEVHIYESDKKGLKVCLIIIQILFRILRREEEPINRQLEAIKKYAARYLNSGGGLRSKYFINMLLQIPKANFNPVISQRKAKRYYEQLIAHPLIISNQAHEIEIIPYEDLWELMMEFLSKKKCVVH